MECVLSTLLGAVHTRLRAFGPLNGLYTPFGSPVIGGQKPQRGRPVTPPLGGIAESGNACDDGRFIFPKELRKAFLLGGGRFLSGDLEGLLKSKV